MGFLIYMVIATIVGYFSYKVWYPDVLEYIEADYYNDMIGSKYFWFMILTPIFWVLLLPFIIIIVCLDKTFGRLFDKK